MTTFAIRIMVSPKVYPLICGKHLRSQRDLGEYGSLAAQTCRDQTV